MSKPIIVYVVTRGEDQEGGSVISVHRTFNNAINAALNLSPSLPGQWQRETDAFSADYAYWTNKCEFIMVEKFELEL